MPAENNNGENTRSFNILSPGTRISNYIIVEKIGAGGMGEVYLADDTKLRRQVALKFLPPNFAEDEEFRDRFLREARAAAALSHPNIITVHDISDFQGQPYIVMEYFGGQSIKSIIRERKLSPSEIINISIQIAEGLDKAHAAGIVHRDIKSDNIMVNSDGRIKIFDFGLAKVEQDVGLTKTGTTMGTVAYMAPEQAQAQPLDHRTDLFSFGVVLYEMISNRLPFTGQHMGAIVNAIINNEPESALNERDDIPNDFNQVTQRLMAKDPKDRYQNASQVNDDLQKISQNEQISTSGINRSSKRMFWIVPILVVILLAIVMWQNISPFKQEIDSDRRKMVVVLPFENLGDSVDDYFASGVVDEITTHLSKMKGLGVISRSSAAEFRGSGKSSREIASELGVDYILEGSIHWDKTETSDKIKVTTSLKNADDAITIWADSYEKILKDIFAVQSDIARKVASSMNVNLLELEQKSIDVQPTLNLDAYTFYLRGKEYFNNRQWSDALLLFEQAVETDSTFADAWAALSRTHSLFYWWYLDRSDQRLEMAKAAADLALQLSPNLAEAHLAMGRYFYRGFLNYEEALKYYQQALILQPNNSDILFAIGSVNRRQGNWDKAVELFSQSIQLDPLSSIKLRNLAQTFMFTRDFDSALSTSEKLTKIDSDNPNSYELKAKVLAYGFGEVDSAIQLLERVDENNHLTDLIDISYGLNIFDRRFDEANHILNEVRNTSYFENDSAYFYLQQAEVLSYLGDSILSYSYYDSAYQILEIWLKENPDDASFQSMLGVAYAGKGNYGKALELSRMAMDSHPIEKDALSGAMWRHNYLLTMMMTENYEQALNEIDYLISIPSEITKNYLKYHPIFDPLRKNSVFIQILNI